MRKLARIAASPERICQVFHEVETWSFWMPDVEKIHILERHGNRVVAEMHQIRFGRSWREIQEVRLLDLGMTQRQLEGKLRNWEAGWRFLVPPDGKGTTLSLDFDIDLGFFGLVIREAMLQKSLDRMFERMALRASERAAQLDAEAEMIQDDAVIRLFRSVLGLEVEIGGETFVLRPAR